MALDSREKRQSAYGIFHVKGIPAVTPNAANDQEWRQEVFWGYSGILASEIVEIWSDATTNASLWYVQNPTETTWDSDSTFWDLNGNTYVSVWDSIDNEWSDQTGNPVTWTDQ